MRTAIIHTRQATRNKSTQRSLNRRISLRGESVDAGIFKSHSPTEVSFDGWKAPGTERSRSTSARHGTRPDPATSIRIDLIFSMTHSVVLTVAMVILWIVLGPTRIHHTPQPL